MTRRYRILFLNRVYPPDSGATGRLLKELAAQFAKEGWDVDVISTFDPALPKPDRDPNDPARVTFIKGVKNPRSLWGNGLALFKFLKAGLKAQRPDVIVTKTDPPFLIFVGVLLARLRRTKHVHWCQDLYPDLVTVTGPNLPRWVFRLLKATMRRAMNMCDHVVVIGKCMGRYLSETGVSEEKITTISNWPDQILYEPAPQMAAAPPPDKFKILYTGTLGKAHPIQTIAMAASLLQETHPDIEFIFAGQGHHFKKLADIKARERIENIRFLPRQPEETLRQFLESGDVHLISMHQDTAGKLVPSKLYPALAVNRPVILVGPMHCETARVIRKYQAGHIVPQGDPHALAQIIAAYRDNPAVWQSGYQGAVQAAQLFTPAHSMTHWVRQIRALVTLDDSV